MRWHWNWDEMSHIGCILSCNSTIRKLYVSHLLQNSSHEIFYHLEPHRLKSKWLDQNVIILPICTGHHILPYAWKCIWSNWLQYVIGGQKTTRCKIDYYRFINGASYNMAKSITRYRCNRYMDTLEQIKIFQQMHLITERLNKILII